LRINLDNFLLITIIGILLLYYFSSTNVYKSLYRKLNEEKNILETDNKKLQEIIDRYEKQVKVSAATLKTNQDNLQVARDDLQKLRLENNELKHEIEILEKRTEELYAQVNTMI
jgi:DNA repair ATPase RecN